MRSFIYKVENTTKNPSIYGGRKQKAIIYEIKRNELIYLGETHWNTSGYRGADSCVNEWLLENKIIPKTWSKAPGDWTKQRKYRGIYWTPYYYVNEKYKIRGV